MGSVTSVGKKRLSAVYPWCGLPTSVYRERQIDHQCYLSSAASAPVPASVSLTSLLEGKGDIKYKQTNGTRKYQALSRIQRIPEG